MFDRIEDTIVAISSPPGIGVRGIVRLSGPESVRLADSLFVGETGYDKGLAPWQRPPQRRMVGRVRIESDAFVPAEVYVFRAPASYTRQDVVELHVPGSPPVLAMIFDELTAAGARAAEPGEFTARAYFAGALDLTEVEGVAAMIQARNDSQLRASEALLHGQLSRRCVELRERLTDLLAQLEAQIDFAEEPIEFVTPQQTLATLERTGAELDALLRDAPTIERLEALPRVLLVGRPNAGKSTLFNRLTGMDRAIQSATAGTTRDVLSAPLQVPGGEIMLLDSAGIGPSVSDDPVCIAAQAATRRSLVTADLIIVVVDAACRNAAADESLLSMLPERPVLIVANKMDALPEGACSGLGRPDALRASALTGAGTSMLIERIGEMLFAKGRTHGAELLALSTRQRTGLREARQALRRGSEICKKSPEFGDFGELLAVEVREAIDSLSLLTGQIATEEVLGRIFSRFCIGK